MLKTKVDFYGVLENVYLLFKKTLSLHKKLHEVFSVDDWSVTDVEWM